LQNSGKRYVEDISLPVYRFAVEEVSARFIAKDVHLAKCSEIEKDIRCKW